MTESDVPAGLSFVEPDDETPGAVNILLYGPPGAGKTTGALSAPGPVLLLNAEGQGGVRFSRRLYGHASIREVAFEDRETLNDVYRHLTTPEREERTVAIDSIGEIYTKLLRKLGGASPKIQHYGEVNTVIEDFVRALRDLDVHLVVICHEQVEDNEEGGPLRRPLTGGRQLPEKLMAMMDVVAYCGVVPGEEGEPARYVGQVVQERGRRAKDRSGALGRARALNITDWVDVIHDAMTPEGDPLPFDPEPEEEPEPEEAKAA